MTSALKKKLKLVLASLLRYFKRGFRVRDWMLAVELLSIFSILCVLFTIFSRL
jgi:hypothetical protein